MTPRLERTWPRSPIRTVGSLWTPQATFTVASVNTDPTNLTVRIQNAAGTESVLLNNVAVAGLTGASTPVAKTATGIFKLNPGVTLDASGYWFAKFEGTGTAQATIQEQVDVDPDEFTSNAGLDVRALVSLAEAKDWLRRLNVDVSNDLQIVRVINDISDRFHQEANREFKPFGPTRRRAPFRSRTSGQRRRATSMASTSVRSVPTRARCGSVT